MNLKDAGHVLAPTGQRARKTLEERFRAKTRPDPETGCILWIGGVSGSGYGMIAAPGRGPMLYAHRVAFELEKGPIPPGLVIRHKCHRPTCVNPDHLETGTQMENAQDAVAAGRLARGPGSRPIKLTQHDAALLQSAAAWLGEKTSALAAEFGITARHARSIVAGKSWADAVDAEADLAEARGEFPDLDATANAA